MVESFNELLPGVPWNDSIVDAIFWGVANNGCSLRVPIYVTHGSADVELELHNSLCEDCQTHEGRATISIFWSLPDTTVWECTRPATKEGLLELLLEARRIIRCMRHGPCAACFARTPPEYNLRLTPEGGCVECVLASFLQT